MRVAIIDVRKSGAIPFHYTEGRIDIRAQIDTLSLVEGVYSLGLYLVTDGFTGDLLELYPFTIGALRAYKHVPYPAEVRGFITISGAVSIS